MNPFYFGPSHRPLFGVHHSPGAGGRPRGVVLLYPLGGEYLRAHRAYRQLTNLLVRGGMHVFRFDYSGTGDSGGDPGDASIAHWTDDARAAVEELKEAAGLDEVSLAGLRLGANLALAVARERQDVRRIVLWDPIESGAALLDSLDWQRVEGRVPPGVRDPDRDPVAGRLPAGSWATGGFPYTPLLRSGIEGLSLSGFPSPTAPVDVLVSSEKPEIRACVARWAEGGARTSFRLLPSEGDWSRGDRFGSALIPQTIIQGVVDRLVREDGA